MKDKFLEKLPVRAAAGKLEDAAGRVRSAAGRVRRVILQPVSKGGFIREYFLGFRYFFRGLGTVFTFRSDLWVWAVLPVFLSLLLYALTFVIIGFKLDDIIQLFLPPVQESAFWKAASSLPLRASMWFSTRNSTTSDRWRTVPRCPYTLSTSDRPPWPISRATVQGETGWPRSSVWRRAAQ